jgi:NAD(P)H-hydrate repair Nnr-like enzyme with NAD(P)H-hydrate epimerase domain
MYFVLAVDVPSSIDADYKMLATESQSEDV